MSEKPPPRTPTQGAADPNQTSPDQDSKVNSHPPLGMNQPSGTKERVHIPKNVLNKLNNPGANRVHSSSSKEVVGKDAGTGSAVAGAQLAGEQNDHSSAGNGEVARGGEQGGGAQEMKGSHESSEKE